MKMSKRSIELETEDLRPFVELGVVRHIQYLKEGRVVYERPMDELLIEFKRNPCYGEELHHLAGDFDDVTFSDRLEVYDVPLKDLSPDHKYRTTSDMPRIFIKNDDSPDTPLFVIEDSSIVQFSLHEDRHGRWYVTRDSLMEPFDSLDGDRLLVAYKASALESDRPWVRALGQRVQPYGLFYNRSLYTYMVERLFYAYPLAFAERSGGRGMTNEMWHWLLWKKELDVVEWIMAITVAYNARYFSKGGESLWRCLGHWVNHSIMNRSAYNLLDDLIDRLSSNELSDLVQCSNCDFIKEKAEKALTKIMKED